MAAIVMVAVMMAAIVMIDLSEPAGQLPVQTG
jgi:hypothetical protein